LETETIKIKMAIRLQEKQSLRTRLMMEDYLMLIGTLAT